MSKVIVNNSYGELGHVLPEPKAEKTLCGRVATDGKKWRVVYPEAVPMCAHCALKLADVEAQVSLAFQR